MNSIDGVDPFGEKARHVGAIRTLVASVRAAGSWKAHCRLPHKQILRLRSLVRAAESNFLARDAGARAAATRARSAHSSSSSAKGTMALCGTFSRFGERLIKTRSMAFLASVLQAAS